MEIIVDYLVVTSYCLLTCNHIDILIYRNLINSYLRRLFSFIIQIDEFIIIV
jgi:hypothetical protein